MPDDRFKIIQPKPKCDFLESLEDVMEEDMALSFYDFYRNIISIGGTPKKHKKLGDSLTKRKIKNLKYIISNYGLEKTIMAMKIVKDKIERGELQKKVSSRYFEKIASNLKNNKYKSRPLFNREIEHSKEVIPIPTEKVTEEYDSKYERFNWMYECPNCNKEIDPWEKQCPECNVFFNWAEVKV